MKRLAIFVFWDIPMFLMYCALMVALFIGGIALWGYLAA